MKKLDGCEAHMQYAHMVHTYNIMYQAMSLCPSAKGTWACNSRAFGRKSAALSTSSLGAKDDMPGETGGAGGAGVCVPKGFY